MLILSKVGLQIRPSGSFCHGRTRTDSDCSLCADRYGQTRTFRLFGSATDPPLGRICNPAARNIRIYNPGKDVLSALKMLILSKVGLQIRPSGVVSAKSECSHSGKPKTPCFYQIYFLLFLLKTIF